MDKLEYDKLKLENDKLKLENDNLKLENENLKKELKFINQIFTEHSSAVVYQVERKTKNGIPIWINSQTITVKELLTLDRDESVEKLLLSKSNRYDDCSWYR